MKTIKMINCWNYKSRVIAVNLMFAGWKCCSMQKNWKMDSFFFYDVLKVPEQRFEKWVADSSKLLILTSFFFSFSRNKEFLKSINQFDACDIIFISTSYLHLKKTKFLQFWKLLHFIMSNMINKANAILPLSLQCPEKR